MKKIVILLNIVIACVVVTLTGCIEDGFSTSPSDQPRFSADTLDLGVIFTDEPSPTGRFKVYNPHKKSLSISRIGLSGDNADCFRINVDGISGREFSDVEIRPDDSVFVFVEATLPPNASARPVAVDAKVDFTTNGITSSVVLRASGQNVVRLSGKTLDSDTKLTADLPYQIFDSLVVAPGTTLTLERGTSLRFHDKASLIVRGRLISEGTPEAPVVFSGDRNGNLVGDISFELMSRQWTGVFFAATSTANRLTNTEIRNTSQGVCIASNGNDTETALTMLNCRIHNSGGLVLEAIHRNVTAIGCEFAEGGGGLVSLNGGTHLFSQCTFANNYLFSAIGGPAVGLSHLSADPKEGIDDGSGLPYTSAEITNSIIYGLGSDVYPGTLDGSSVYLRRCLLKSKGEDDEHFLSCIWGEDPLYYTVRSDYFFDYRLQSGSPAIGAADPALMPSEGVTDAYGLKRGEAPDLGAYVFSPRKE